MPQPIGTCRLCLTSGVALHDSHVVPQWAHRRLFKVGGGEQPMLIEHGIRRFSGDQDHEHMLCWGCEQRFKAWEDVVATISKQVDGSFPALQLIGNLPGYAGVAAGSRLGPEVGMFALSVIWRAAVYWRRDVRLGPYQERVRRFLLGEIARVEDGLLVVQLVDNKAHPTADWCIGFPYSSNEGRHYQHNFAVFGFSFYFLVGNRLRKGHLQQCYLRSGLVNVVDGHEIANHAALRWAESTPKGKKAVRLRADGTFVDPKFRRAVATTAATGK